ncbi:RES family NAD+ phosphorylase [Cyanobium sp. HWJ4-Hawea]|nr:RES family NAD+ phosphorylase [Cyanobium sp. HWJ4-Hawea]
MLRIYSPEPRGILYAGLTLSCCLVECFGDTGVIDAQGRRLAFLLTTCPLQLLELRGRGAMRAGSVAALASTADRDLSQDWSRHFHATYLQIDGVIYSSAHNEEAAVALYERAEADLHCEMDYPLDHRLLRSRILKIANDHAMEAPPG